MVYWFLFVLAAVYAHNHFPTRLPTFVPSDTPTLHPGTRYPTLHPRTEYPTRFESAFPTKRPTEIPTTLFPSLSYVFVYRKTN